MQNLLLLRVGTRRGSTASRLSDNAGPRRRFELREPRERFGARRAAHLGLRLEARTARGPLGASEDRAAMAVVELHAAHARGLAVRHAWDRTRDRRRDAARAAIGAARVIG